MIYSASNLGVYEQCPRRFCMQYVTKAVKFVSGPEAAAGVAIHEKIAAYIKHGMGAPPFWSEDGTLTGLRRIHVETRAVHTEVPLGMRADGAACLYDDPKALVRGALDVYMVTPTCSVGVDWKSGKLKEHKLQADVYTALMWAARPTRDAGIWFHFLERGPQFSQTSTPEQAREIWGTIQDRIETIEGDATWIPKRSGLCAGWCVVPPSLCEFSCPRRP